MKKEYELLLNMVNNQIKDFEEKLVKLKREYQEKCAEYNNVYRDKYTIETELESIDNEISELKKDLLSKEYKKNRALSLGVYSAGFAATLGMIEGSIILGNSAPLEAALIIPMVSIGIGLTSQVVGEFKYNGGSKKVNRKISENNEMIDLNKKKEVKEKQFKEIEEKVERLGQEKERAYLAQDNCKNDLNLMELFKLEYLHLVNSGNTNSIEESKEKKPYEKPMMRIRRKED